MRKFRHFMFFALVLVSVGTKSAAPELDPGRPERYVVKPGDTLWDIAGLFLRDPWRWKEVWRGNPGVADPDKIYPGDVLYLTFENGQPRLGLERPVGGMRDIKLSPGVRRESLTQAIHTIPLDAIQQFLTRPRVMDKAELDAAPQVIGFVEEHIVGGGGDMMYARAVEDDGQRSFDLVRIGRTYRDPDTGETLGTEAQYVGDAELLRAGDPAKFLLVATDTEAQIGDRLLPDPEGEFLENFQPRPAPAFLTGKIISVLNGVNQVGLHSIVLLNKGGDDGLEPGDVMRVVQQSRLPKRVLSGSSLWRDQPNLPLEDVGALMVFRTFERVSYALVLQATRTIYVKDTVVSPAD